jgi:hypothetical protein
MGYSKAVTLYAIVSFKFDSITVPAGKSVEFTVIITLPADLNATLLPVYSGYITLGDKLVLLYMGVVGSMRATPVLPRDVVRLADGYSPASANKTYTILRPDPANLSATDCGDGIATLNVYIRSTVGTRMLCVNVLQGSEELGALAGWSLTFVARFEKRAWINRLLADGSALDDGTYRLRVRALRIFGVGKRVRDVVETVAFGLKYKV